MHYVHHISKLFSISVQNDTVKKTHLAPMVKMRAEMEFVCKRSMKSLHLCLARSRCLTFSPRGRGGFFQP